MDPKDTLYTKFYGSTSALCHYYRFFCYAYLVNNAFYRDLYPTYRLPKAKYGLLKYLVGLYRNVARFVFWFTCKLVLLSRVSGVGLYVVAKCVRVSFYRFSRGVANVLRGRLRDFTYLPRVANGFSRFI